MTQTALASTPLFDRARLPGLSRHGRELLQRMRDHPQAPHYRDFSGHRLGVRERWQAAARHAWLQRLQPPRWLPGETLPTWVPRFVDRCVREVGAHARKLAGPLGTSLDAIPTMDRHALVTALALHVPHHRAFDELICFSTSGTTGHPLRVPSHPSVACEYQAYHRRALAHFGITPQAGRGQVGIVLAGFQQRCFTYVSVNPLQGECGLAKLNLHTDEWRHADDRARYLDAMAPELISGDPVSLAELLRVGMTHRPRALMSTSMALAPALRAELERAFACPVANLYSLNEVGPAGVFVPALGGFALLQPRLLVEIVDDEGHALPPGQRGEITVTGGFNPWLPLLRYRTGDFAQMAVTPRGLVLRELEGRAPVRFRSASGQWLNNIEATRALAAFALTRFSLHQCADASFVLKVDAAEPLATLAPRLASTLKALLGETASLHIEPLPVGDKVRQYTSELCP